RSSCSCLLFCVPATTVVSSPSLHDALPIFQHVGGPLLLQLAEDLDLVVLRQLLQHVGEPVVVESRGDLRPALGGEVVQDVGQVRSEEHTSELQSRENLVCRLLLETKNTRPA